MLLTNIILFIVSLTVLLLASDRFIDAAEKIGLSFGISPFIIGVTIVAFGTSLPELATSIASIYSGSSEIVVGNVVGSNITNILLVLGLTAIIAKEIKLEYNVMDMDMPLLFGSAFLMYFVLQDFHLSTIEGLLFIAGLVVFLLNSFSGDKTDLEMRVKTGWRTYVMFLLGGALVYLGATYTIYSVEQISLAVGIGPEVIALSIIALGTSLPEVIVSIMASRKGKHGIAVGNVLGSNMFNTFAVMGISSFIGTLKIPEDIMNFSLPFMVAVTVLFGIICLSKRISKWEGVMLVLLYVFFMAEVFKSTLS